MKSVKIGTEYIKLDSFLKFAGVADMGSHAKHMILDGAVRVNGEAETRRGRKLRPGDIVEIDGHGSFVIE